MKVLIVEDNADLNRSIVDFLQHQHYLCESVSSFRDARHKIESYRYDCIILDLTLPGGDGLKLVAQLKEDHRTDGLIIISARNELDDKIRGIELGADDYLTKPFHLSELAVRIAALIRRKSLNGHNTLVFEEIELDAVGKNVVVCGQQLILTRKEYDLLMFFIINKNRVISKNAIVEHLWGDDMDLADSYGFIYTHIKNLRKKIIQAGAPDYIHSVYGMGYKFGS